MFLYRILYFVFFTLLFEVSYIFIDEQLIVKMCFYFMLRGRDVIREEVGKWYEIIIQDVRDRLKVQVLSIYGGGYKYLQICLYFVVMVVDMQDESGLGFRKSQLFYE